MTYGLQRNILFKKMSSVIISVLLWPLVPNPPYDGLAEYSHATPQPLSTAISYKNCFFFLSAYLTKHTAFLNPTTMEIQQPWQWNVAHSFTHSFIYSLTHSLTYSHHGYYMSTVTWLKDSITYMKFTLVFLTADSPLYIGTIKETHILTSNRLNLHINEPKYGPINNLLKKSLL
jgi:hypothetical protein